VAEFTGWDSKKIGDAVSLSCMPKIQAVADLIANKARSMCPTGTDALKGTIRTAAKKGAKDVWVIAGNKKVDYARFVEYGTVNTPAHPFMRPALRASKARAKKIVES